jgi:hypothetical protein
MKNVIFVLMLLVATVSAKAQLNGTKWRGNVNVPEDVTVLLNFQKQTLEMTAMDGNQLESMSYTVKGDTILLKKLSGGSPCDLDSTFKVKYTINDDKLSITPLTDDCEGRQRAWQKQPFTKVKD